MKLSLDRILEKCPKKLLKIYPMIAEKLQEFADTPDYLYGEINPLIIMITGSRYSGKTEFVVRSCVSLIYDGYVDTIKYATLTENGLNGSKDAFERLAPECKGTGANVSKREPMHRYIGASRIDFDFFGKDDIKNEQKKYDILGIEEVEKWNLQQGIAALETEIRHCKVIILISNNPPSAVVDFCKVHDALFVRCDWFDNTALPAHLRESCERAKIEQPVYYTRFIMCQNDTDAAPWFDNTGVENFFSRNYTDLSPDERIAAQCLLSIDVGAGYGDESIIAKVSKNRFGGILVEVEGRYQLESPQLVVKVAQARAKTGATEEIWDANGIGLTTLQQRAPDPRARAALGVVAFYGNATALTGGNTIFNQRTEAYSMWQKAVSQNQCWYVGNPAYIDQIKREMYAQVYATPEQSKGMLRLAEKKDIKKNLNGESPNIADAIAMGIWRITTHTPTAANNPTREAYKAAGIIKTKSANKWF
ncbi:MAG: hypothetical protein IKT32_02210 [Clostridia bacterium]|nr:hypothetical protein [Clostridia bacterium]